MKKRYLLIDSENVQNRLFEIIENSRKRDNIVIFYTVHHSGRLEEYMHGKKFGVNVEFVECLAGKNALDLQLMGVLAYLIQQHPKREFVIYSNDKGYRTAVKHWQSKRVDVELISFDKPTVGAELFQFTGPITIESPQPSKKKKKKNKNKNPQPVNTAEQNKTDVKAVTAVETVNIPAAENKPSSETVTTTVAEAPEQPKPIETESAEETTTPHIMTKGEYINQMCHCVQTSDFATMFRVLSLGLGDESKTVYNRFKKDEAYREEMSRLYYPTKPERLKTLMRTALRYNSLDENAADEICAILNEKGTSNMQQVYLSFIQRMPGTVGERQNIYKAVKPYFSVLENI